MKNQILSHKNRGTLMRLLIIIILVSIVVLYSAYVPERTEDNLESDANGDIYNLNPYVQLIADPSNELTLSDITSLDIQNDFTKHNEITAPSYSYTDSTLWAKIQQQNPDQEQSWLLELGYSLLNQVDFFILDDNDEITEHIVTGNQYPFYQRDIVNRNFVYQLPEQWNEDHTFYIRVETDTAMILPITLWETTEFMEYQQDSQLFLGVYYGVILVIVIYTMFLYIFTKVKDYLYYSVFIASMGLFLFTFNGLSFQYLWPNNPWWAQVAINFFIFCGSASGFFFTEKILPVYKFSPLLQKLLAGIKIFAMVMIPLTLFLDFTLMMQLGIATVIAGAFIVIPAAALCWFKGHYLAVYMFYGWVIFAMGISLMVSRSLGLVPDTFVTMHGAQLGFMIKIVLLFLALADNMQILRQQKENVEEKNRHFEAERQKFKQADTLNSMLREISLHDDIKKSTKKLLDHINKIVPFQYGCFIIKEGEKFNLLEDSSSLGGYVIKNSDENRHRQLIEKVFNKALSTETPLILDGLGHGSSVSLYPFLSETKSAAIIPMVSQGKHYGVLVLESFSANAYSQVEGYMAMNFAGQASLAIENARLFQKTSYQAITDGLTGLYNRRYFADRGNQELDRARRYRENLSVIILDIDDFKQVNDTWGHTTGDKVIQAVAELCLEDIRNIDIACRYGGEEFAILLIETDLENAASVAERIRIDLENRRIAVYGDVSGDNYEHTSEHMSEHTAEHISVTASFGVASSNGEIEQFDDLIIRADKAMYLAKEDGKNNVVKKLR